MQQLTFPADGHAVLVNFKISQYQRRRVICIALYRRCNTKQRRYAYRQELQGNRPIIVRVFDELARQLAPRVFFTQAKMQGADLAINGVAESNNRISNQLRNFSDSEWFEGPNVTAIKADPSYGPQASQFAMTVEQTTPKREGD